MKKTLIALAVLGVTAGVAHAQSNVTIYGIVDTGFVKEEGSRLRMDEKVNNRIGFRGVEDLGGGLKATFELEKRFDLFDGATRGGAGAEFDGASNLGLAGNFGAVRFGRMNELSTESFRTLDPFNQYGVGGMFETPLRSARISNTTRYDSPSMGGFSMGASYTLQVSDGATDNDGYAVSVKYKNGPIAALANYNRAVNSDDSYNWNIGGSYAFGPAKVSLGYEDTTNDAANAGAEDKNWLVGMSYVIGSGVINASYNHRKSEGYTGFGDATDKKIALGYTHNLSKRTSVYLDVANTKYDSDSVYLPGTDDSVYGIALGVTHKF